MQRTVLSLVVWPYLARRRLTPIISAPELSFFTTSSIASRPSDTPTSEPSSSSSTQWSDVPYIPTPKRNVSLPNHPPLFANEPPNPQRPARELFGLDLSERRPAYSESSAMALKRIIQIYQGPTVGTKAPSEKELTKLRSQQQEEDKPARNVLRPSHKILDRRKVSPESSSPSLPESEHSATTVNGASTSYHSQKCPDTLVTLSRNLVDHSTVMQRSPSTQQSNSSPPAITHLLNARLYRLAVFSILRRPDYLTDPTLIANVVKRLQKEGAGKLAAKLTFVAKETENCWAGPENIAKPIPNSRYSPETLKMDPLMKQKGPRKPPDHWNLPPLPPTSPSDLPSSLLSTTTTRQSRLTAYHNAQLTYILSKPSHPAHQPLLPLSKSSHEYQQTPRRKPPSPSAALYQLKNLLHRIDTLERHRGFKPDRVTGNIILKCWLRCAAGLGGERMELRNRWRMIRNSDDFSGSANDPLIDARGSRSDGGNRVAWKKYCEIDFGVKEIRALFEIVSRLMSGGIVNSFKGSSTISDISAASSDESLPGVSSSSPRTRSAEDEGISEQYEDPLDYSRHIRPFCELVKSALQVRGDREGFRRVVGWQKEMKAKYRPRSGSILE